MQIAILEKHSGGPQHEMLAQDNDSSQRKAEQIVNRLQKEENDLEHERKQKRYHLAFKDDMEMLRKIDATTNRMFEKTIRIKSTLFDIALASI